MTWPPWRRRERRSASYTDAVVAALVQAASGGGGDLSPLTTGAVEIGAGRYASAFAAATVAPPLPALDPATMAEIARDVIRHGQYLAAIDVASGAPRLLPAAEWEVFGSDPRPETWRYRLTLAAPSGSRLRTLPAAGVVHVRYARDHRRPWAGLSPLTVAARTGRLAAALELALGDEATGPVGQLAIVPPVREETGAATDPLAGLRSDMAKLRGGLAMVEGGDWGNLDAGARPREDWRVSRIGAAPPAALVELRGAVESTVLAALGIPAALHGNASATAAREGWRAWREGSIQPLGRVIAAELAGKLDAPGLAFDFGALQSAADITARARAAHVLKEAGVDTGEARRVAGI